MRTHHLTLTEHQKDMIGHVVISLVLITAFLLAGCDAPVGKKPVAVQHPTTTTPTPPRAQPAEVIPASNVTTESAPATPAVTGPVAFSDAESAYRDQRYDDATRLFTAYTSQKPDNAWGYYMLGLSAWKAGDRAAAESAFTEALSRDPFHIKSRVNLGRVLIEDGQPDQAIGTLDTAIAMDSTVGEAYRVLGVAQADKGDVDDAITSYRHAARLDDHDAWSPNNLGLLLIRQGRYDEALAPLARAVAIAPDVPVFQNNLGIALERTGHFRQAADAYRAALAADSTYGKAQVNLDRVKDREDASDVVPVDLTSLANDFVRGLTETSAPIDSTTPDTVPAVEPQTAPVDSAPVVPDTGLIFPSDSGLRIY